MTDDSLGRMIANGRQVRWLCMICEQTGQVDLNAVLAAKGPDFSFANRRPPCRYCPGRVRFVDKTSIWPRRLDTISSKDPDWWAFEEAEKKRLTALGWRLAVGSWIDPEGLTPTERRARKGD
ncbi:hypothetical protein [Brevundimonas sp.]|uniref:hypothetical protein n=1 Tax=Brevundimonas sp. TaxID=1871086 RepID=UPI0025BB9FA3|nr:hypothetical protein [Brevundimonas sp.]